MKYVVCLPLLCVLTSALRIRVGLEEEDLGRLHDKESNKIISNSTANVTLRQKMLLDESQGSKDFGMCWQFITHGCGYPIPIFLLNKCCKWCVGDKHWWPRCQKTKKAPTRAPTKSPTAASPTNFCGTKDSYHGLKLFIFPNAGKCRQGVGYTTWHLGKPNVYNSYGTRPGFTCGINCFTSPSSYYYGSGFLQHDNSFGGNRTRFGKHKPRDQINLRKNESSQITALRDLGRKTRDQSCDTGNRMTPLPNPASAADELRRATFTYYFHTAHGSYDAYTTSATKTAKIPLGGLPGMFNACLEVIGGEFAIFCEKPSFVWCDDNGWDSCSDDSSSTERTTLSDTCCSGSYCTTPYGSSEPFL